MSTQSSFWVDIAKGSGSVLGAADRINEILFGLIMVLTFTCSISIATEGREEVATVLWGALGCNIAWGIIDGLFFLLGTFLSRGEALDMVRQVRNATSEAQADECVKDALPPLLSKIMSNEQVSYLRDAVKKLPEPPAKAFFTWRDMKGTVGIFLLVFLSTFPPTIPFIFINDLGIAMRVSNGIALALLFAAGYILGQKTGRSPFLMGVGMMFIGALLVAVTIALGG